MTVLRSELDFLEKGGYRNTARAGWRPPFIFQDSTTCLNFDPTSRSAPLSECTLMQLTPADAAKRKITCRFIPLNDRGETIDSFYRSGTAEELESAFGGWLRSTIERRESKYGCQRCVPALPAPSEKTNSTKL